MVGVNFVNLNSSCVSATSYSKNILVFLSKNIKCKRILPKPFEDYFKKVLMVFGLERFYGKKILL